MDSNVLNDKPDTRNDEVVEKYRQVFLTSEAGRFVLTDILNELGEYSYRSYKSEYEMLEAIIKSNLSKLILWKLGIWRVENAKDIVPAIVRGWDEEEEQDEKLKHTSMIRRLLRLPWNKRTEEKKQ